MKFPKNRCKLDRKVEEAQNLLGKLGGVKRWSKEISHWGICDCARHVLKFGKKQTLFPNMLRNQSSGAAQLFFLQ